MLCHEHDKHQLLRRLARPVHAAFHLLEVIAWRRTADNGVGVPLHVDALPLDRLDRDDDAAAALLLLRGVTLLESSAARSGDGLRCDVGPHPRGDPVRLEHLEEMRRLRGRVGEHERPSFLPEQLCALLGERLAHHRSGGIRRRTLLAALVHLPQKALELRIELAPVCLARVLLLALEGGDDATVALQLRRRQLHRLAAHRPRAVRLRDLADDVLMDGGGQPLHRAWQRRA
mmetsp:Transcript_11492/g.36423  ORF Transcript_11492/g.36423 Transcript_11492/m.36423 type:complete len:231 (+) Transcript_11492:278-970(+)